MERLYPLVHPSSTLYAVSDPCISQEHCSCAIKVYRHFLQHHPNYRFHRSTIIARLCSQPRELSHSHRRRRQTVQDVSPFSTSRKVIPASEETRHGSDTNLPTGSNELLHYDRQKPVRPQFYDRVRPLSERFRPDA
jgi:hypothetical protein